MWRIEFSSAKFLPFLPEGSQANPGVYGFELASWLSKSLADRGIVTSYPIGGEDWGWMLQYQRDHLWLMIGCSSLAAEGEGYTGEPVGWSIFVEPHAVPKKWFGANKASIPQDITEAIEAVLLAKGIETKRVE